MLVYASIGNSDDKLSQYAWAHFLREFRETVRRHAERTHGDWISYPHTAWQNACICFEIYPREAPQLRRELTELRKTYRQDSIAWAEAPSTEFL